MRSVQYLFLSFVLCSGLFLAACGSDSNSNSLPRSAADCPSGPEARQRLTKDLRGFQANVSTVRLERSVPELLATTQFVLGGQAPRPLTRAVVRGQATSARPGVGYLSFIGQTPRDAQRISPNLARVAYDDPRTSWRTVILTLRVDEVLSGQAKRGQPLEVAVRSTSGICGYLQLEPAVWFLDRPWPEKRGPLTVTELGAAIAPIGKSGELSWPFYEGASNGLPTVTLGQLRAAAHRPVRVIEIRGDKRVVRPMVTVD